MSHRRIESSSSDSDDYVLFNDVSFRSKMDPYGSNLGSIQDLRGFTLGYCLVQVLGLTCMVLVLIWTSHYLGGFAGPSMPKLEFNYHPVFMVLGLVFLYGNGILVYRALRDQRKSRLKLLHAAIQMTAFICAVVALRTVFDSHNLATPKPIPNLYSLHSWVGITTVILFCMQFACGFTMFLFPGARQWLRVVYLPLHVYFGLAIFAMAVATALLGISEKLFFKLSGTYKDLPREAVLGNSLALCLVAFAVLVMFMATRPSYRRMALSEEAALPLQPHTP